VSHTRSFTRERMRTEKREKEREKERDRERQVNDLNVRSSLWKKETPSLEHVDTSRVKREVIVRQISLNLTDLYTLNVRGPSTVSFSHYLRHRPMQRSRPV